MYVSREPLGKHSPSSTDAESPLTRLKTRLGTLSQPIPEGSSGSSAISPDSNAGETAAQAPGSLPNGVVGQHAKGSMQNGHKLDASSEGGVPGELKQTSALSAALSDGPKPVSSQDSGSSQAGDRLSAASSAAGSGASSGFQEPEEEKHGHSAPRSIPSSGRQAGRAHAPRAAQHSSSIGVSSSSGTALFWTGSHTLGISFADDPGSAESVEDFVGKRAPAAFPGEGQDLSHSSLEAKAKVYGTAFEDAASPEHEKNCTPEHDGIHELSASTLLMTGRQEMDDGKHKGVQPPHNSVKGPPAEKAVVERVEGEARQLSIGDTAAAAIAEVDAETSQQDAKGSVKAQPASSMSGELPPGEQLSEQGSIDEERDTLGVSPVRLLMNFYIYALRTGPASMLRNTVD